MGDAEVKDQAPAPGLIPTLAGSGRAGAEDGEGKAAQMNRVTALALDSRARLLVAAYASAPGQLRVVRTQVRWEVVRGLFIGWLKPANRCPPSART